MTSLHYYDNNRTAIYYRLTESHSKFFGKLINESQTCRQQHGGTFLIKTANPLVFAPRTYLLVSKFMECSHNPGDKNNTGLQINSSTVHFQSLINVSTNLPISKKKLLLHFQPDLIKVKYSKPVNMNSTL